MNNMLEFWWSVGSKSVCFTHAVGGVGRLYFAPVTPVNQYVISLPLPCGSDTHRKLG